MSSYSCKINLTLLTDREAVMATFKDVESINTTAVGGISLAEAVEQLEAGLYQEESPVIEEPVEEFVFTPRTGRHNEPKSVDDHASEFIGATVRVHNLSTGSLQDLERLNVIAQKAKDEGHISEEVFTEVSYRVGMFGPMLEKKSIEDAKANILESLQNETPAKKLSLVNDTLAEMDGLQDVTEVEVFNVVKQFLLEKKQEITQQIDDDLESRLAAMDQAYAPSESTPAPKLGRKEDRGDDDKESTKWRDKVNQSRGNSNDINL